MIHPVRPVGWSALSAPAAVYALCRRLGWLYGRCRWLWCPAWLRLPLVPAVRRRLLEVAAGPATGHCRGPAEPQPPPLEPWQPWPAHPPFADEVTRWWPSDDWPPAEPPVVIEDQIPDVSPEIIDWRTCGGLLDFWV